MLATTTVRLVHHIRLRHSVTGRPIGPLIARLDPAPYGWSLRVRGTDVVVAARDGAPNPEETPTLTLAVTDRANDLGVRPVSRRSRSLRPARPPRPAHR